MSSDDTYESLVRPIETQMMQSVWRIAQNKEDAEDAFQEAAAALWKRIERIKSHPNPQALILRICLNAAYDVVRRRSSAKRVPAPAALVNEAAMDGAQELSMNEQRVAISRAISRLPERQATAVSMRFLLDQPYSAIAAALGCREATVRVHVTRGVAKLRSSLSHLNSVPSEETTDD